MLSVSITNTAKTKGRFTHTEYELKVQIDSKSWYFWTRYRKLLKLHRQLQKSYPNPKLPFPPKKRLNKNDQEFVNKRRRLLQNFLNHALLDPKIVSSKYFQTFFQMDKHCQISKFHFGGSQNTDNNNENEKIDIDKDKVNKEKITKKRNSKEKNEKHLGRQQSLQKVYSTSSIKTEESDENSEEDYDQRIMNTSLPKNLLIHSKKSDLGFSNQKRSHQNSKLKEKRKDIKVLLISSDATQYAEEREQELVNELLGKSFFVKDNIKVLNTALKVPQLDEIPEDCRVIVCYSASKIHDEVAFGDLLISWLKKMNEKEIVCGLIICYGSSNDYYGIKGDITKLFPTTCGKWFSGIKHSLGKIIQSSNDEGINLISKTIMKNVNELNGADSGRSNVEPKESCHVLATWDDVIPLVTLRNQIFENSKLKIIDLNYFPVAHSILETDGIIILGNSIEYLCKGISPMKDED
ncbi:sorting nexin-29-related [Anaeramoeba flamelloides]|uniref:Sorting nexin-29-related n=1 Tax=Anaeramoeba flamelloides TaxID=1746091 RepID=A0ABQ8YSR8_9EUKA|nr:sorting nexin-29-related [Anaeramoeba flamelloides]